MEVSVPPLGRMKVGWVAAMAPADPEAGDASWILTRQGREGRLVLGGGTALQIVAATLGVPAPPALRLLGAAERGIVAAVVAGVLAVIDAEVSVSLRARGTFGPDLVRVVVALRLGAFDGRAFLDVPWDWIPPAPPSLVAAAALTRRLSVPVVVALARTTLPVADWARARRGDAVLFDGCAAVKAGASAAAYVACGRFEAPAELTASGQVYLREGFDERVGRARGAAGNSGSDSMSATTDESRIATSLNVLAAAPLEVVAEIGRAELRADELLGLRPGAVLPFGPLSATGIDLRVGDRLWARGELVDVDGQLGVRITELAPAPEGAPAASAVVAPEDAITRRF